MLVAENEATWQAAGAVPAAAAGKAGFVTFGLNITATIGVSVGVHMCGWLVGECVRVCVGEWVFDKVCAPCDLRQRMGGLRHGTVQDDLVVVWRLAAMMLSPWCCHCAKRPSESEAESAADSAV